MNWYALYTKPRWEKKVFEELQKRGIEAYCPMSTEVRQWSDRKKKVSSPLFKSYVFVHLPENQRSQVFEIPGAVRYLFWLGKPAIVKQKEIDILRVWLENKNTEEISVCAFKPGDEIVIPDGKLKGKEAVVTELGKRRIRLVLKELGLIVNIKLSDAFER